MGFPIGGGKTPSVSGTKAGGGEDTGRWPAKEDWPGVETGQEESGYPREHIQQINIVGRGARWDEPQRGGRGRLWDQRVMPGGQQGVTKHPTTALARKKRSQEERELKARTVSNVSE